MKIDARIRTVFNREESSVKALANVILDDCFIIKGVRLIQKEDRQFIVMPSFRGNRDGNRITTSHPIIEEFRKEMESVVIAAYEDFLSQTV